MNITVKDVSKKAAKLFVSNLILGLEIAGVLFVAVLLIAKPDIQKHPWLIGILAIIIIFGFFILLPIVYLVARNNKKVQIGYIKDIIENKYVYARVLRNYSEDFARTVRLQGEVYFAALTDNFSKQVDDTEEQRETAKQYFSNMMQLSFQKAKKIIDETDDPDRKQEMKEAYRDHKKKMLELVDSVNASFDLVVSGTLEDFQKEVDIAVEKREQLISENTAYNENSAKEQEDIAREWENFLQKNYA